MHLPSMSKFDDFFKSKSSERAREVRPPLPQPLRQKHYPQIEPWRRPGLVWKILLGVLSLLALSFLCNVALRALLQKSLWDRERIAEQVRQIDHTRYGGLQTGVLRTVVEQELLSAYKRIELLDSKIGQLTIETDGLDKELHDLKDKVNAFKTNEYLPQSATTEGMEARPLRGNELGQAGSPGQGANKGQ